jgi:hypothetical protein
VATKGLGVLYSANQKRFPRMSEYFIEEVQMEASGDNAFAFYKRTTDRLREIPIVRGNGKKESWNWFEGFQGFSKRMRLNILEEHRMLLILAAMLEAMEVERRPLSSGTEMINLAIEHLSISASRRRS